MYIADVIPLASIPRSQPQIFSYFLPRDLPRGAVVEIPMGRRVLKGVVVETRAVHESKLEIRKSAFTIKSVKKILSDAAAYTPEQLELFFWMSETYGAPLGKICALYPFSAVGAIQSASRKIKSEPQHPCVFVQGSGRIDVYRQRVQEALAKKKHLLLMCPDALTARVIFEKLRESTPEKERSDILLCRRAGKKALQDLVTRLRSTQTPLAVIGTRSLLFLPCAKLDSIIIEAPGDGAYAAWGRTPRYHAVETAVKLAQIHNAEMLYGDIVPTAEIWSKIDEKITLCTSKPATHDPKFTMQVTDLRREKYWSSRHPLTAPIKNAIRRAIRGENTYEPGVDERSRKQIIIYLNRKGVATAFVCKTCGYIPRCEYCEAAMVLHETSYKLSAINYQQLRCHHCGATKEPPRQCEKCQSYKFFPVGTGTSQVEKDVRRLVPEAWVLRVDSDVVKNERELERQLAMFRNRQADILIGTQLSIKEWLLPDVPLTVLLGVESFFAFPAYDAKERVSRLFTVLASKTTDAMMLQALNPDMLPLQGFGEEAYKKFLEGELAERKEHNYPPFGKLVKLTFAHRDKSRAAYESKKLFNALGPISYKLKASILGPSPAFIPKERGRWKYVLLLKLPLQTLPEERATLFERVPSGWQIDVNPRELL